MYEVNDMELGTYKAVKDVAMRTGNSAWMLTDGGTIELVQIDKERSKALYRCGRLLSRHSVNVHMDSGS